MTTPRESIGMNSTTLLLMLHAGSGAATCLQVDGDGRVLARRTVDAGEPLARDATQPPSRQVLAVPGVECLSPWQDLPQRHTVQALAAASRLVTETFAG